jgi:hypothetical protein
MPAPLVVNSSVSMKGFFTKALFLRSQPAAELERRLGYASGRLLNGWWLLFLLRMPTPNDFEFMGYSQMSGGIPQGHLHPPGGLTAEQSLAKAGYNLVRLKQKVIMEVFRLSARNGWQKPVRADRRRDRPPIPQGAAFRNGN